MHESQLNKYCRTIKIHKTRATNLKLRVLIDGNSVVQQVADDGARISRSSAHMKVLSCYPRHFKTIIFIFYLAFLVIIFISCTVAFSVEYRQQQVKRLINMSYRSLLSKLYSVNLYNPVKLGLDNMVRLNEKLGNPLANTPVIHVTGTNGKGSVCVKLARALQQCGMRTGLFVSPHIASFKERVQVNQQLLSDADVEVRHTILQIHCD